MSLLFFKYCSHLGCYRMISRVPFAVLYSRSLLVIYFKYSSVYMSIPNRTQFISMAVASIISSHFFLPLMTSLTLQTFNLFYLFPRFAFLTITLWYISMHQHIYIWKGKIAHLYFLLIYKWCELERHKSNKERMPVNITVILSQSILIGKQ